jgi:protein-tyrosine phosphatase
MERVDAAPIHIDLDGTVNTRDLGGWPRQAGGHTRRGRIWRSDALTNLTPDGRDRLAEHGVRTVIDLRTATECADEPSPLCADGRFEVVHVDLFAPVLAAFMRGEVRGDPFDLATHYLTSFRVAREDYARVFGAIARATETNDGPTVIHCTAGKDRTGLVAALLLRAAGVSDTLIAREYGLTHERIAPLRPRLLADGLAKGMPAEVYERLLEAREETMLTVLAAVDDDLQRSAAVAARALG